MRLSLAICEAPPWPRGPGRILNDPARWVPADGVEGIKPPERGWGCGEDGGSGDDDDGDDDDDEEMAGEFEGVEGWGFGGMGLMKA